MLEYINHQELKIIDWLRDKSLTDSFTRFLKRGDSYNRFITGISGWIWEDEFIDICKALGYHVYKPELNNKYDVCVNGFKVQCKFTADKKKIDLRNKDKNTNRRYYVNDIDFFAIKIINKNFLVPANSIIDADLTFLKKSVKIKDIENFTSFEGLKSGKL